MLSLCGNSTCGCPTHKTPSQHVTGRMFPTRTARSLRPRIEMSILRNRASLQHSNHINPPVALSHSSLAHLKEQPVHPPREAINSTSTSIKTFIQKKSYFFCCGAHHANGHSRPNNAKCNCFPPVGKTWQKARAGQGVLRQI